MDGVRTAWLDGDPVSINGQTCSVSVSGNAATVQNITAPGSGEHWFAFSPASLCPQPSSSEDPDDFWWEGRLAAGEAFDFEYPREYDYAVTTTGLQAAAFPMVAVAAGNATSLTFRHLAAAVEVHLSNPMNVAIEVDSVVVEAATACLNGAASFTLDDTTGIHTVAAPAEASPSYDRRSVRLTMPDGWTLAAGGNCPLQLPVPPLPDGEQLTVRVHGRTAVALANYDGGSTWMYLVIRNQPSWGDIRDFTFSHSAALAAALERTHLVKARAEIRPDGHLLDSERSISRLSLFSLSDTKKVLFKKYQYDQTASAPYIMPTRAEMEWLLWHRPQDARYTRVEYSNPMEAGNTIKYYIIFPDGYTAESVRSLSGMGVLDESVFNGNSYQSLGGPTTMSFLANCYAHGFMVLSFNNNSSEHGSNYTYRLATDDLLMWGGLGSSFEEPTYELCIRPLIGD